jgi:MYXO-CTERM domain-containing protein
MSRTIRLTVALLLGLGLALVLPASANAAAFRYWGYYHLTDGKWQFYSTGPAQSKPADGSVEGWRFAVGTEAVTRLPRAVPTFEDICGGTKAEAGKKRVAVVIDYGRKADSADGATPPAPVGRCAVVATSASGQEVLTKVAPVNIDKDGIVCSIDRYPTACGGQVDTVTPAMAAADTPVTLKIAKSGSKSAAKAGDDSHTGTYLGIGIAVLAVLGVGAAALRRRRTA